MSRLPGDLLWGVVAAAALVALTVIPAAAQATDAEREAAMAQTVQDQLAAFRRGDWGGAYTFASAAIQSQFTLETFREMVSRGYAPIARPLRGTVLGTRLVDPRRGYVEMRVEGQDGETIDALYELVDEHERWRINGVLTKPTAPGPSA